MKKIGDTQLRFLRTCRDWNGYAEGGGWVWGGRAQSLRLAERLVALGLLEKKQERFLNHTRDRYTVSGRGMVVLDEEGL